MITKNCETGSGRADVEGHSRWGGVQEEAVSHIPCTISADQPSQESSSSSSSSSSSRHRGRATGNGLWPHTRAALTASHALSPAAAAPHMSKAPMCPVTEAEPANERLREAEAQSARASTAASTRRSCAFWIEMRSGAAPSIAVSTASANRRSSATCDGRPVVVCQELLGSVRNLRSFGRRRQLMPAGAHQPRFGPRAMSRIQ
jgi:hypothetical protein